MYFRQDSADQAKSTRLISLSRKSLHNHNLNFQFHKSGSEDSESWWISGWKDQRNHVWRLKATQSQQTIKRKRKDRIKRARNKGWKKKQSKKQRKRGRSHRLQVRVRILDSRWYHQEVKLRILISKEYLWIVTILLGFPSKNDTFYWDVSGCIPDLK